jgi:hypothetical protein
MFPDAAAWCSARPGSHPCGCGRAGTGTMTAAVLGERGDADLAAADLEHQLGARAACPAQEPEHDPDEVVCEAAERFAASLALSMAALEVGAGPGSQRPWPPAILCSAEFSRRSPLARLAGVAPIDASSGSNAATASTPTPKRCGVLIAGKPYRRLAIAMRRMRAAAVARSRHPVWTTSSGGCSARSSSSSRPTEPRDRRPAGCWWDRPPPPSSRR